MQLSRLVVELLFAAKQSGFSANDLLGGNAQRSPEMCGRGRWGEDIVLSGSRPPPRAAGFIVRFRRPRRLGPAFISRGCYVPVLSLEVYRNQGAKIVQSMKSP